METFWDNIIKPTPAELLQPPENDPFGNLLGTSAGLDTSVNDAGAQAVFPALSADPGSPDSLVAKVGAPAGFGTPPAALSPDVFATWHTAYQEEYINANGGGILQIGSPPGPTIHAMLSSAQDKVYILETLQKADFAKMTLADQTAIAATDTFRNVLAPQFGLSSVADDANNAIANALADINNTDPNSQTHPNSSFVDEANKDVFRQELTNIENQLPTMGVFSTADISAAVKAIQDRFDRVAAFAKAADASNQPAPSTSNRNDPNDPHPETQFVNVISLDNDAAVKSGLQNFMNAERQILAADNASIQLAATGTLQGLTKHLDAPALLAAFQMNASLKDQAINAADTEEINQINELLKTYNAMQELINQTIATFDASKSDEKRGLLGYLNDANIGNNSGALQDPRHVDLDRLVIGGLEEPGPGGDKFTPPALTDAQLKVISMFEQQLNGIANPIEDLLGIKRPTFDFYDNKGATLNYFEKSTWDQISSTLGNTVQQISEQNQLKFNDINTREKQRTAEFQSAQDALAKAADLASTIGRNIG
jgi:hypothetical protein